MNIPKLCQDRFLLASSHIQGGSNPPWIRIEISTPTKHAIVNSCSLAWGIPAMKLRKISGLMKELQEAIKTTKAYWPSLKQMRKNRHGKRDSRVSNLHYLLILMQG